MESLLRPDIPFNISSEFVLPEFGPRRRKAREPGPFMSVPAAAMDEDRSAVLREDKVRATGKAGTVQTAYEAYPM